MKLPKSYYNMLSFSGSIIAITAFFLIIFLLTITTLMDEGSSYLGLFSYILLPGIMILGMILIPIGMIRTTRRARKKGIEVEGKWSVIDFNNPTHRNALSLFGIITIVFILLSSVGSYEAYHYTESVEFCGTVCHTVMEPEYVTYQHSGHARVSCAECHVGSGANWYVKSKFSGLYQVYSVLAKKYPKPIATPISSLRPAQQTCEQCHWPQQFYADKLQHEKHFLSDEENTEWNIHLSMKTGGTHSTNNMQSGIHWHINPDVVVEYISPTPDRETIPWVRYINKTTGDTIIYEDSWAPLEPEEIAAATPRTMDCMDCHNRPAHKYKTPAAFVDLSLAAGEIPTSLPQIKHISMQILKDPFPTKDTAHLQIDSLVKAFYAENYPGTYSDSTTLIEQAIAGIISGFDKNIFPAMGASWDAYPDHIGHMEFNGCFRCHNDSHESALGEKITKDCNACHTILQQGIKGQEEVVPMNQSLEFKHPEESVDEQTWKESLCTDCHRYLYL